MTMKLATQLVIVTILLAFTGIGFFIFEEGETELSINGVVCNYSSTDIWLAVSKGTRHQSSSLAPNHCTNFFTQDAEAIWGRSCSADPCVYQAWKVGAGRFSVYNDSEFTSESVLRIQGWGAGSYWHIAEDWPKPELSSVNYSLVK